MKLTSREWRCGDESADGECRHPGGSAHHRDADLISTFEEPRFTFTRLIPPFSKLGPCSATRETRRASRVWTRPAGHTQCFITWCAVYAALVYPTSGLRRTAHTRHTHRHSPQSCVSRGHSTLCVLRLQGPSPSRGHCVRLQSPSRPLIRSRPWDGLYLPYPPLAQSYPPTSRPPAQAQARAAQRRQPQRAPPSRCPH